ncbi:DUF4184 family protein [Streptomyces endophyticus]|uniref:DUF4184 family protein n=1 Tax=Streptomyces endophyticus TaxID=714166 RepID=A0ABU6F638_9ACTN|nr:DUF4184 family protein [Streptomyces endophyticus]MEB8339464.1 DUF4184 family protein [Streptomyces endophyticus]
MPFTISHAAAVLPFIRRDGTGRGPLVPALLVAGSFAPDLTYYAAGVVPGAMGFGAFTHSFTGVFTVDVGIALAVVALWRLVREPLLGLVPGRVRGRLGAVVRPRPRTGWWPLWWYVSASLGATTHVVWDAFTHPDRWGMRLFPVLGETFAGYPLYWYAQYAGSAAALAVLAAFAWWTVRGAEPAPAPPTGERWLAWSLIAGCACVAGSLRVARWLSYVNGAGLTWQPWEIVPTLCFGAGAGVGGGVLLYALVTQFKPRRRPVSRSSHAGDG